MSYSFDSDSDADDVPAIVEQFGNNPLVIAVQDTKQVKMLIADGCPITADAIHAACYAGTVESLHAMLGATASPSIDARSSSAESEQALLSTGKDEQSDRDISPCHSIEKRFWYAIQHASCGSSEPHELEYGERQERHRITSAVLDYNPDLYANFLQPLWIPMPYPFPGEPGDNKQKWWNTTVMERKLKAPLLERVGSELLRKPIPECGYGLRSALHALFEDGAYLKPFFEHPNVRLDMDRRDPQGRTLLHSICRNAVGADASTDAIIYEKVTELVLPAAEKEISLFHTVRKMGADVFALDYAGKSILHHLLEARDEPSDPSRTPCIRNTLIWILQHAAGLINQPDHHGIYPLHSALQGMRRYPERLYSSPQCWAQFDEIVERLLEAGADMQARDSRGNSALHYLADSRLAGQWECDQARKLFRMVLDGGVDVNARNALGRTAMEILLDEDEVLFSRLQNPGRTVRLQPFDDIDRELFGQFDTAGVLWTGMDPQGNTLLHVVARHGYEGLGLGCRIAFRTRYLLSKGIDRSATNSEGKTVVDIAREADNKDMLKVLEE